MENTWEKPLRGIWSNTNATSWEEGYVAGNGEVGAIVYGDQDECIIVGNHHQLFLKENRMNKLPDIKYCLKELRTIIESKGYQEGINFFEEQAIQNGYNGLTMSDLYHPAFKLKIETNLQEWNEHIYCRSVNFETGLIEENISDHLGNNVRKRIFVSEKEKKIYIQLLSSQPINLAFYLEEFKQEKLSQETNWKKASVEQRNTYIDGTGYVTHIDWEQFEAESDFSEGKVRISNVYKLEFSISINTFEESPSGKDTRDFETLLAEHIKYHKELYSKVQLNLVEDNDRKRSIDSILHELRSKKKVPLVLYEKLYDASRYIIQAMSGKALPNLQGIWSGDFTPAWSGDYTFDTNVQLAIASLNSLGLSSKMEGFFEKNAKYTKDYKENAKKYYGCRGYLVPVHASTTAKHVHWNKEWPLIFWTAGAGWNAHFYQEYYDYTLDEKFLELSAIPFYEETILFYEDFLLIENDKVVLRPSYSAENGMADTSTMDIAVLKETITNLIEAYKKIQKIVPEKYNALKDQLPDYLIDDEGVLKEWIDANKKENHNHRHFSNLYPVFQSKEITKANKKLWQAANKAFDKRLEAWLLSDDGDTSSSHGRMHAAMCAVALERPKDMEAALNELVMNEAFYPSLVTSHYNYQTVFNVDANGSLPKVIHDAIIYPESKERVTLFKAMPSWLQSGEITGIRLPQAVTVEQCKWDIKKGEAELELKANSSVGLTIELSEMYNWESIAENKIDIRLDKGESKIVKIDFSC
jgi:hypothetical protein